MHGVAISIASGPRQGRWGVQRLQQEQILNTEEAAMKRKGRGDVARKTAARIRSTPNLPTKNLPTKIP